MLNGHKNWNHWNVSLWIKNDEGLYRLALECIRETQTLDDAARKFIGYCDFDGSKTPDGVPYTFSSVRAAIRGMK
jgi:hypothetical protein